MKNSKFLILFLLCIALLIISCDLVDDSPCGPKQTYDLYLIDSDRLMPVPIDILNTYVENGFRVFQWGQVVENVCTDEHLKASFRVAMQDDSTAKTKNIIARGRISWQFLYEKNIPLVISESDLKGNGEVGLKSAFPDLKGWFVPYLEVIFPVQGTLDMDKEFLKKNVIAVEIIVNYREYKD